MKFLKDIFGEELTAKRRIAVFTTPNRRTRFFADYQELERYALDQSPKQNVYFGLGLIEGSPKGRGKLENIAGIGGLWCDIDISGPAHPKKNLPKTVEEAQSILAKMPLRPSIVVFSGHGLHAYWLLHEPWVFETIADRATAMSLAKRWHGKVCSLAAKRGWALENLGDLTRVLRLPGTLNHNGAEGPVEVGILENRPDLHYAADDFEQFLPVEEPVDDAREVVVGELILHADAEPSALKLLDVASTSPLFWETWNRRRSDLADSSQSGYDLSLATIAALSNWTDQEIANLIVAHRRHHEENPAKALRGDYVRRTIAKARRAAIEDASAGEGVDLSALLGRSAVDASTQSVTFAPHAVVKFVNQVERQELEWLWPGRIPLGKLTLLAGDPGLGKSFVTLDMAARVSRGECWPDLPLLKQTPAGVVLFNAEDDLADTIAPRLDRAGADDTRILAVEGVAIQEKRRHFSLEVDLPRLEEVLRDHPETRLVIIDPIAAYCGKVDSHKNSDVRGLLAPLAELAARYRVAVVSVTHLSKSGGNKAVYRAMGSLAFAAAARAVWAVVKDTDDPQRRLFLPAKMNLAGDPSGLAYRITDGRVAWESGSVHLHADDAFAAEAAAAERKPMHRGGERREAAEWLKEQLAEGPTAATEIIETGEQYGFSKRTLQRALTSIDGERRKESFEGAWMWYLPT
jgi:putative DNA primase/helicase